MLGHHAATSAMAHGPMASAPKPTAAPNTKDLAADCPTVIVPFLFKRTPEYDSGAVDGNRRGLPLNDGHMPAANVGTHCLG